MSWFISELDERFLNYIKEKLVQKIKDENSVWSQFYGHLKLTERDVTITSTGLSRHILGFALLRCNF